MKLDFNRKYTTIAVYAILVVAVSAVLVVAVSNFRGIAAFLGNLVSLLMPFIIGFVLAYVLNPILNFFEQTVLGSLVRKRKLSRQAVRAISMIATYLVTIFLVFIFFSIVIPQVASSIGSIAVRVPAWITTAQGWINQIVTEYGLNTLDAKALEPVMGALQNITQSLYRMVTDALPQMWQATLSVTTGVVNFILGIIISIYILSGKERFFAQSKKLLFALMPKPLVEKLIGITHQSHEIFSGFISGKILDSFIIGIICFVGMTLFQFPYAMLISVVVGVTNIIPYFGPFFGAIPSILIMLIVDPIKAIWLGLFILLLQQLDGNVIGPKILGDSTGLSAFWVIFAITVFGNVLGVFGMFIGVPLFAVIYSLIRQFAEWRLNAHGMPAPTAAYASEQHALFTAPSPKKLNFLDRLVKGGKIPGLKRPGQEEHKNGKDEK